VTNSGPLSGAGIELEDGIPDHTTFVFASDGGAETGGAVNWPPFDLAAGESTTRTLTVEVELTFPAGTTEIVNVATVTSDGSDGVDPDPSNNTAIDVDVLDGGPDVAVTQSADLAHAVPGDEVVYTLTLSNAGFQPSSGTVLTDILPPEVIFLTASDDGGELDGTVTWPAVSVPVGETVTRTLRVLVPEDLDAGVAELVNTATAASSDADPDPSNNTAVHTLPVVHETDLTASISAILTSVEPQTLEIIGAASIVVSNQGNADVAVPFEIVVFEDVDGDALYDSAADNLLGQATLTEAIAVGEASALNVPVTGTVAFRNQLLYVFVDATDVLPELDETNNVQHSGGDCEAIPIPGDFDPVVEVEWPLATTDVPFSADSLSTPIVVHLTDDDGDGRRGEGDIPDIVFVSIDLTFPLNPQPRLRAISGDSGAAIFDAFPPVSQFLFFALTGMAAADVDLDGAPEIIVPVFDFRFSTGRPNRLAAYSHTGQLQWISQPYSTHPDGDSLTNRDHPTIADLDRDGVPEILVGANVFNADGSLRWAGTGGQGYQSALNADGFDSGAISIVADLDLEGDPEVVTGNTAYRSDGSIWWQIPMDDGYTAVGNFDGDDFPEIVVVSRGVVRLHQHDGTLIWAAEHPGAGPEAGGAPTVADFDGDSEPEIGVAGSTQYAVFEGDGTVLWQTTTQDGSSNMTGSTVFDLDGDGRFEVIYRDETALRIYRGADGVVLYELPLSSVTLNEQPVVADVDGDGNVEIVVTSDVAEGISVPVRTRGLRVIGDEDWVAGRGVWNQHAYHVGNVGDDGTVPAVEAPSWLDHNTYRANVAPATGAFAAPDLSASRLVIDLTGYPAVKATARVGNGGAGPASVGLPVAFYEGDPSFFGRLVATAAVSKRLDPGDFEDVTVTLADPDLFGAEVWAVADDDGTGQGLRTECDEFNNFHGTFYDTEFLGLILTADDGLEVIRPGDTTTYVLRVANATAGFFSDLQLRATLPPGTTLVAASDGGTETGGDVVWPGFPIGFEEVVERTLTLEVDPAIPVGIDTLIFTATVAGAEPDPSPENNTAVDVDRVLKVIAAAGGPYAGGEGEEILFDGSASFGRGGALVDFRWDLDSDGAFDDATGTTVSHAFADDGVFSVAVRVEDENGESDVATATVTVVNLPPSFDLGADLGQLEGTAVVFDGLAFTDPGRGDTHIATVDWGDGILEEVALLETGGEGTLDVARLYVDDGLFNLELCVADDDGATVCDQLTVTVANALPEVVDDGAVTVTLDEGGLAELSLPFKDSGPEDTHTSLVDWGDGSLEPGFVELSEGSGVVVFEETFDGENSGLGQLSYSSFERWEVSDGSVDLIGNDFFDFLPDNGLFLDLDGTSGDAGTLRSRSLIALTPGRYQLRFGLAGSRRGGSDTVIIRLGDLLEETIQLPWDAPLTTFSLPFSVEGLTAAVLEFEHLGGDNVGLLLDDVVMADECVLVELDGGFGSGGSGGEATAAICGAAGGAHVYPDDGTFDAAICVTDDDGGEGCGVVPVEVRNVLPAVEAGDVRVVLDVGPMALDAVFADPGILDPHEATISWGDSTVETAVIVPDAAGGSLSASHVYAAEGDYAVEVCVTDDDGIGCDFFTVFWRRPRLDVAVILAADTIEARPGQTVVMIVEVANQGSLDPGVVTVTQLLPEFLDFVSASAGGVVGGGTVVWTIPSLDFDETRVFTVILEAPQMLAFGTEVTSTVTVAGDSGVADDDPADDVAAVTLVLWDDETPYVDPIDGDGPLTGVEGDVVSLSTVFSTEVERLLLDDAFDGENGGGGALNYFGWAHWRVSEGTVDLIGTDFFDFLPDNGLYVDLDGSSDDAARFASRESYELRPGTYVLAFDLAGSQRLDTNTVHLSVGDLFSETFTFPAGVPLDRHVRTFIVETPAVAEVVFDHDGGDDVGLILDDVRFFRGCASTATIDWGDGIVDSSALPSIACGERSLEASHVYDDDGVYTVELCITDADGDSHCVTTVAVIANAPPVAAAAGATVAARRSFTLEAGTFTDAGALDLHTATIDWGDGIVEPAAVDEVPGTGTVGRSHGYTLPGTYDAVFCVLDDDDGEGCAGFTVIVTGAVASADLISEKVDGLALDADGDGIPGPGDFLVYDVVVSNLGGLPATGVTLRDVLEPDLRLVPGGIVPGDGTVVSENPVEVDLGTLDPGASKSVQLYVEILASAAGRDQVANQAVVTSVERPALLSDDPDVPGSGDPTVTMISPRPRLVLSKTDALVFDANSDGVAAPGDMIEYVLELRSLGNVPLTDLELLDPIPDATEVVAGSVTVTAPDTSTATVLSESPVAVSIDVLDVDQAAVVRFLVVVTDALPPGTVEIVNQAAVAGAAIADVLSDDPDVGGDADPTATPALAGEPELKVEKTDVLFSDAGGDGLASPGDTLLYQLTVVNVGTTAATGVVLRDSIDADLTVVAGSVQTSRGTVLGESPVEVDLGEVAVDMTATVSFRAVISDSLPADRLSVSNQATVSSADLADVASDDPDAPGAADPTATEVFVTPEIAIADAAVIEGDGGNVTAVFDVTLSVASGLQITVDFATTDGSALDGMDYVGVAGSLSLAPGQTLKTVSVPVLGDGLLEPDETFFVTLSAPSNAEIADGEGVGTIVDDELCAGPNLLLNPGAEAAPTGGEIPGWLQIESSDWRPRLFAPEAFAGDAYFFAGTAPMAELAQDVEVSALAARIDAGIQEFAFAGFLRVGDEMPPDASRIVVEYRDATNALVLGLYESEAPAAVLAWEQVADVRTAPAGTRWIRVRLLSTAFNPGDNEGFFDGLSLRTRGVAAVTIDDVVVHVDSGPPEAGPEAAFTVRLACPVDGTVSLEAATVDGTARAPEDYQPSAATVTFTAGETEQFFAVPIIGDGADEPAETFFVDLTSLASPVDAVLLDSRGTATILDRRACPRSPGFWKNHRGDWPLEWLRLGGVLYGDLELMAFL
ncbi:MAG: PKD domain-containing protein, partial [Thermoanaerobaculia bacterium]